jgi:hypothetical protein
MGDLSKMGMAVLVRHSARHVRLTRKRVAAPVAARREVFRDGSTLGLFKTLDGLGCDSFIARNGRRKETRIRVGIHASHTSFLLMIVQCSCKLAARELVD